MSALIFLRKLCQICNGQQDGAVGKNAKSLPQGLFALEITLKLPCRWLERLHDVTDHYKIVPNHQFFQSQYQILCALCASVVKFSVFSEESMLYFGIY